MEFEAGEQRMTPEMYEGFGFQADALPSHLHMARVQDESGRRIGFYGDARFSKGCIAECEFDGAAVRIRLLPIDLDLNRARAAERGLPAWASREFAREIAEDMKRMSEPYGTRMVFDEADGSISVET